MRARYYDPAAGRFISEDTNKGQIDNPLTLNRYNYVHNNPLRFIDPSGNSAAEGAGGYFGGNYNDLMLHWSDVAVAYADANGIDFIDAVDIVVPVEHRAEVKTIVGFNGAVKAQYQAGDMPDLGMAAPVTGVVVAGTVKNTAKSSVVNVPTNEINVVATKNNYRKLYTNANPGMPSNYQVHHTLPQKYDDIMKKAGINIHETQYLRGVDPAIHSKITTAWTKWEKSLGRTPTAQDVQNFAKEIDKQYGQYWYKP